MSGIGDSHYKLMVLQYGLGQETHPSGLECQRVVMGWPTKRRTHRARLKFHRAAGCHEAEADRGTGEVITEVSWE